jgi:hypothetical protein
MLFVSVRHVSVREDIGDDEAYAAPDNHIARIHFESPFPGDSPPGAAMVTTLIGLNK